MMRYSVTLALICTLVLCAAYPAAAQGSSVAGRDVLMLAKTIVKQTETTYTFPPAYLMRVGGKSNVVVTAPVAFEILARTLCLRANSPTFPQTITGLTLLFSAKYEPTLEPARDQRRKIGVLTPEIVNEKVQKILEFTVAMQNTVPRQVTLSDGAKLTAAQFLVAMAMMVKEWGDTGGISELIAVPAVFSPANWDDQLNPIPIIEPVSLRIAVNGITLTRTDDGLPPEGLRQPFCNTIQLGFISGGPVKRLAVDLDGQELCAFDRAGSYGYALDTLRLTDGPHRLAITLIDAEDKSFLTILPLQVHNGRVNAFTPAELEQPPTTPTDG